MPPRRPGGKYKGMVGRAKGDATLAAEAAEKARKMQEEYIKRMQEKRERELLAGSGLTNKQQEEEEARKQRVINQLMGGKKGAVKKCFKAWVAGKAIVRKQRGIDERENNWRRSCGHLNFTCPGGCSSSLCLRPAEFLMPFEASLQTGITFHDTASKPLWPCLEDLHISRSTSLPQIIGVKEASAPRWLADLDRPLHRSQEKIKDFIDTDNSQKVIHHRTGRRCFIDPIDMKMGFADVARRTAPSFFNTRNFEASSPSGLQQDGSEDSRADVRMSSKESTQQRPSCMRVVHYYSSAHAEYEGSDDLSSTNSPVGSLI